MRVLPPSREHHKSTPARCAERAARVGLSEMWCCRDAEHRPPRTDHPAPTTPHRPPRQRLRNRARGVEFLELLDRQRHIKRLNALEVLVKGARTDERQHAR